MEIIWARKSSHSPTDIIRRGQLDSRLIYLLAQSQYFTLLNVHAETPIQPLVVQFTSISCLPGFSAGSLLLCDWSQSEG